MGLDIFVFKFNLIIISYGRIDLHLKEEIAGTQKKFPHIPKRNKNTEKRTATRQIVVICLVWFCFCCTSN